VGKRDTLTKEKRDMTEGDIFAIFTFSLILGPPFIMFSWMDYMERRERRKRAIELGIEFQE